MTELLEQLHRLPVHTQAEQLLAERQQPVAVTGLTPLGKALMARTLWAGRPQLILCHDEAACRRLAADLEGLGLPTLQAPYTDLVLAGVEGASREFLHAHLAVLGQLVQGFDGAVLTTPHALAQHTLPPDLLRANTLLLERGQELPPAVLLRQLVDAGYSRAELVEGIGQFAVRGGIIDVFVPGAMQPVRLEYFGDEIDSISSFDLITQRRSEPLEELSIPPASKLLPEGGLEGLIQRLEQLVEAGSRRRSEAAKTATALYEAELERVRETGSISDRLQPLLWQQPATLLDYLPEAPVLISDERACSRAIEEAFSLHSEELKSALEEGILTPELTSYALNPGELWSALGQHDILYLETLPHARYEIAPLGLVSSSERQLSGVGESLSLLEEELRDLQQVGCAVTIFAANELRRDNLLRLLEQNDLLHGHIRVLVGAVSAGVVYTAEKLAILTDAGAGVQERKKRRPRAKTAGEKIRTYNDLREGDFVVHQNYGIGRYLSIVQMKIDVPDETGMTHQKVVIDSIKIQYQGKDVLYVPANQLDLVSKYISGDEKATVRLSKMGGAEWHKTKQRVRGAARDMARQLTALYAARQQLQGYAFEPDSEWQAAFEADFPYTETDDQLRCIEEAKRDMERPIPMDRLLCGDVGFGKTEVAMRAAFKAIDNGKQVAFLVPTTILSWQHYTNVLSRFSAYPMRIDNLSRFRTPRQQEAILRKLRTGELDMVIGTHRLIQKDVQFKNLGLLVVDEEQRFGVGQKERLKELFKTVDVLTLTATPIPRTLGMALSGIRDMSVIEEPPQDRHPVQTYVLEHDDGMIVDAIRKELRRGGQVFYLHNRVDTIDRVARQLQERLPDARIVVGHGKMGEDQLSEIWEQTVAGEVDILVCTTIIETGVDVPNANTLIVEDADRLGLSQLYQIRGRVGRSNRRAYAYFTYRKNKVLSEDATKRLSTIREFTQFGSGFKIAMRDLEIRGAGNVLGAEQHGHMEAVGYDLYLKLLEEAVQEEQGTQPVPQVSCSVDFVMDANIPKSYIASSELRIDIYKKIAAVESDEELGDLYDELCDRFGDIPRPLQNLCRTSLLRSRAGKLGIEDITERSGNVVVDAAHIPMEVVASLAAEHRGRILFSAGQKPYFTCRPAKGEQALAAAEWAVARIGEAVEGWKAALPAPPAQENAGQENVDQENIDQENGGDHHDSPA